MDQLNNITQEFIFETLLFYRRTPCYYKIFQADNDYFGIPMPHHYYSKTEFPHFIVQFNKGQFQVKGVNDETMVKAIISEFEKHLAVI